MAILIKRYANRKLYNTETSRYITLKGIAKLLDQGEEVHVIDKETGEDITQIALSQILVDNKRAKEDPSDTLLTQILSRGGDALYGAIKKSVDEASDGLGEFQDRFKHFVSQSEAVARGERGFGWDARSESERRSPFTSGSTSNARDRGGRDRDEDDHAHSDGAQHKSRGSTTKQDRAGWPRMGGFPDLRELIQNAVKQSVAHAVSEVLDARDLAHASDLEALNTKLERVAEAVDRLERSMGDPSPSSPNTKKSTPNRSTNTRRMPDMSEATSGKSVIED